MNNNQEVNHDAYWANLWILLAYSDDKTLSPNLKKMIRSELTNIRREIINHTNTLIAEIDSALEKVS